MGGSKSEQNGYESCVHVERWLLVELAKGIIRRFLWLS